MRALAAALVALALVAAACTGDDDAARPTAVSSPPTTMPAPVATGVPTTPPATEPLDQSLGPVAEPLRNPATARSIYFVMPDRFENGDPGNDTAGVEGGPLEHGFDPTRRGYHHGGDLAGLTERLPYLDQLGIGAIWITPPFTNRWVQGDGSIEGSSSSYHGYWQIDFGTIDPHLGTDGEMQAFIAAAHDLDMHVYFDVVVNHTGDVIRYAEGDYRYRLMRAAPYLDADGNAFDPIELAGTAEFPELDAAVSFPYTPVFDDPADATVKSPDWLDDVTLYHNRGDSLFRDESDTYGDFFGLDDLFTEHPRVVAGMVELYGDIIERYDIDGFRVDTMKHVNPEFWEVWAPAMLERAAALGKPDFVLFGEIFNSDPVVLSSYTQLGVPATLDFIVNEALHGYVAEAAPGEVMARAFDADDWFTDHDNNASMQVTFFGNHDEGRMGRFIATANPRTADDGLLARARLAFDLLFLTRGAPVVYYGDEQGFTGDGNDQLARQSMFPSVTPEYVDDDHIGTDATPADDNFDLSHPLWQHVAGLNLVRSEHPAFGTGAQYVHDELGGSLFGFSRIDRDERMEYVVITSNNASSAVPAELTVLSRSTTFTDLRDPSISVVSDATGVLRVDVPPLGAVVLRAETPLPIAADEPSVTIVRPDDAAEMLTTRYRVEAEVEGAGYAEVTFAAAIDGGEPVLLGVDDAPPYRIYWDTTDHAAGTEVEFVATVSDGSGRLRSDTVTAVVGERPGG